MNLKTVALCLGSSYLLGLFIFGTNVTAHRDCGFLFASNPRYQTISSIFHSQILVAPCIINIVKFNVLTLYANIYLHFYPYNRTI